MFSLQKSAIIVIVLFATCIVNFGAAFKLHKKTDAYFKYFTDHKDSKKGVQIIGGQEAEPHKYPYQVALIIETARGNDFCGASLIAPNYLLTTASCMVNAISVTAILGAHNLNDSKENVVTVVSEDIILHEDFDSVKYLNDIALIKLPKPIKETDTIKIVKLIQEDDGYNKATATGWGKTSDQQHHYNDVLQKVELQVITNSKCRSYTDAYKKIIKEEHLCTAGEGTLGVCDGDAGSPLVSNGLQIGISSFHYVTCEEGYPSVFTRVSKYGKWIDSKIHS